MAGSADYPGPISALALATGAAFAREELSLTEPGTGQELMAGYEVTSEGDVISSEGFSEPMNGSGLLASSEEFSAPINDREALASNESYSDSMSESDWLALSEPDLIYSETTIAFVPSVDSETPMGG